MAHINPSTRSDLIDTLSSLEPTSMVTLYELDFRNLGLSPDIRTDIAVDVGVNFTGQDYYMEPNTVLEIISPRGNIINLTANQGTVVRKFNDTIQFTPPNLFEGRVLISVLSSEAIVFFHSGLNDITSQVVWQGNRYQPLPILADGFELNPQGQLPRPRLVVANVMSIISTYIELFDELLGAKVTRRRTFAKYLDPANFASGVNPSYDATAELAPDVYKVNRKVLETKLQVEFELVAAWDIEGVQLPRRQVLQNLCSWEYRSTECSYTGMPVATDLDVKTQHAESDNCGKRLKSCALRFGEGKPLPFGGFPAAGVS